MVEISVIVPCYNQSQYIKENIESLVKQTFHNFEVIVINDGSTDNSLEVIYFLKETYKKLNLIVVNQKNSGLSNARNSGVKVSTAPYILPLDADDKLSSDALEKFYKKMKESDAVDIIYSDAYHFEGVEKLYTKKNAVLDRFPYEDQISYCALYKKTVWEQTGGYKENMAEGYEDWEFWVNCYKRGFTFSYLSETLFYYRVKKVSRDTEAVKKDRLLRYKVVLNNPEVYPDQLVQKAKAYVLKEQQDRYTYQDASVEADQKLLKRRLDYLYAAWENQEEIKTWMLELDDAKNWLESENQKLIVENRNLHTRVQELEKWSSELEEAKVWLENEYTWFKSRYELLQISIKKERSNEK